MMAVLTVALGLGYPFAVWGVSQIVFPHQANGSLIEKDGKIVGSELIGQQFQRRGIFSFASVRRRQRLRRGRVRRFKFGTDFKQIN